MAPPQRPRKPTDPAAVSVLWDLQFLDVQQCTLDELKMLEAMASMLGLRCTARGDDPPDWLDARYEAILAALEQRQG